MAIKKSNGHGVTSVLANADNTTVVNAPIKFPPAPTQNGGFPNASA
jgi:hypothetical protein